MTAPSTSKHKLQKRLGLPFALAISIGSVIGTGIMRAPGVIVNEVPVFWIAMALWAGTGLLVLLAANVTAELGAALPKAGGHYVAVHAAFGDSMGLLSGWTNWLANVAGTTAVAIACADFLGTINPWVAAHVPWTASAILLAVTAANAAGVREGKWIQIVGTALKLGLLCAVVGIALLIDPVAISSSSAATMVTAMPGGIAGFVAMVTAIQIIWGAYDGWFGPIYFSEEDKNPGRNIPRALFTSVFVVIAVYLIVNLSLFKALDITGLRTSELPMGLVIEQVFGRTGNVVVALIATIMALVTLNSIVMPTPRILFAMARDGLFPQAATRVNRGGTPIVALGISAMIAFPLIWSGGYIFVFKLTGALSIFASCLYLAAFFALRRNQPDLTRPFRAIGYPLLPALALAISVLLLIAFIAADPISGVYMAALIAICIPVGFVVHRRRITGRVAA
ncbi:APC family permease [Parasphingorhabdus sp.]|uniref:APC family permease n=1 Tax=Parasphingorhabdus sp. TaxID=2709688 RepID=UPI003002B9FF